MENELIQLYNNSNLPKEGWIQGCFHCSLKTSLLIDIMTEKSYKHKKKYLFQCFLCKDCRRTFSRNDILYYNFIRDCKIYIYDKYYDLISC